MLKNLFGNFFAVVKFVAVFFVLSVIGYFVADNFVDINETIVSGIFAVSALVSYAVLARK